MTDTPPSPRPRICVYCGSRTGGDPAFSAAASRVGSELARQGADVVYGGGHIGLMGIVADAALAGGSHVVGVITEQLREKEIEHTGVSDLRVVPDMPARKAEMYGLADAFLTLPGGIGTMEEFFEVLTWRYLGIHPRPMGLLNVSGFYDPLLDFLEHSIREGLTRESVRDLLTVRDDPAKLVADVVGAVGAL